MITWHTDNLTAEQIDAILGPDTTRDWLADPDRVNAHLFCLANAHRANTYNRKREHAAYRSLARMLAQ